MPRRLTKPQLKFCLEYFKTGNASEAHRRAYPKSLKWKPESVHRKAHELLQNVKIEARLKELAEKAMRVDEITAERIIKELASMAFANVDEFLTVSPSNGVVTIDLSKALGTEVMRSVESIKQEVYHEPGEHGQEVKKTELKFHSKIQALTLLMRNMKMLDQSIELKGKLEVPGMDGETLAKWRAHFESVIDGSGGID